MTGKIILSALLGIGVLIAFAISFLLSKMSDKYDEEEDNK